MGWTSCIFWLGAGTAGLVTTVGALLYLFQEKLLYIPSAPIRDPDDNPYGYRNPSEQGIAYEDLYMRTADNLAIHGWLLKSNKAHQVPTIVYLHGNAGNIGLRLINARQMQVATGCNVLLVDYRGYGKSEGTPYEEGMILDVEACLRALKEHPKAGVDMGKIVLFGRSLGGAVAFAAAERYHESVRAVIVENTFLSVSHMVDEIFPWLSRIKWLVLRLKWNSEERVRNLKKPILFISGLRDQLIPPWHMRTLYNAAAELTGGGKRFVTIANGSHNDTWEKGGAKYLKALANFIDEVFEQKATSRSEKDGLSSKADLAAELNGSGGGACDAVDEVTDKLPMTTGLGKGNDHR